MATDHLTHDATLPTAGHVHHEWPYRRSAAMRYGVAVLAVAIAFGTRYMIYGDLQNRLVFAFFVPAAIVSVWYGGVGPGMLATVLGMILGDFFFLPPRYSLGPLGIRESLALGTYAVTTMLCVLLCERLHKRIRESERTLDHERHHPPPKLHPEAQKFARQPDPLPHPGWPFQRPFAARYGIAVGVVILAFVLRYWLFGTQDHRFPFIFFVPAAMIAAWYGGMAPGLLATAAGLVLGDYFFLSEHEAMGPVREIERLAIGLYAVTTTLCVMLFENMHNRIRRLEHALDRAQHHHHLTHPDASAPGPSAVAPPSH